MTPHPVTELFPRLSEAERAALREDIRQHGVRVPIVIHKGQILDGRHRWEACRELGLECPTVEWDGRSPWLLAQSLNLIRRHLPADQVAMIRLLAEQRFPELARETEAVRAAAAARRAEGQRSGGRGRKKTSPPHGGKVSHSASAATAAGNPLGVSARTVERAQEVLAAAPDLAAQVAGGTIRLTEAKRQVKRREVAAKVAALPPGQYRVIYAAPPWSYSNGSSGLDEYGYGLAGRHYPTLSMAELSALDVKGLASPDAVLFLWVPSPLLAECWGVVAAWGFAYKASFVWDKVKHNFGHYNSVRHEFLLVCTRGSCLPDGSTLYDSVHSVERGEHSEKPEAFRTLIDAMYPQGPRIELFARRQSPGWDAWGPETTLDKAEGSDDAA